MFKPKLNQTYWMINSRFEVKQTVHTGSERSQKRINVGNCFKSKKAATKFKDQVMVANGLVRFSKLVWFALGFVTANLISLIIRAVEFYGR